MNLAERRALQQEQQKQQRNQVDEIHMRKWAEFKASYPRRLLNLVYEYSRWAELNVRKDADRDSFVFSHPRHMNDKWFPVELPEQDWNFEFLYAFAEAEQVVESLVLAEKEAERVFQLRQQALSKLSAEERAALSL